MYPKLGPGQLWEYVSEDVRSRGGIVKTGWNVDRLRTDGFHVTAAEMVHADTGERDVIAADYFFSTMPIKELMHCLDAPVPKNVMEVSDGLIYRDFITVGVLLKKLKINEQTPKVPSCCLTTGFTYRSRTSWLGACRFSTTEPSSGGES